MHHSQEEVEDFILMMVVVAVEVLFLGIEGEGYREEGLEADPEVEGGDLLLLLFRRDLFFFLRYCRFLNESFCFFPSCSYYY